jgi:hypothetical protein
MIYNITNIPSDGEYGNALINGSQTIWTNYETQ